MVLLQDGSLYAMGKTDCCGQESEIDCFFSPVLVSVGNTSKISSICCSYYCTIVQTINNEWYGFGYKSRQSSPAYGKTVSLLSERIDVAFPKGIQVKKLITTTNSFFLLSTKNELYVVGRNDSGEMGMNNGKNIDKWTLCKRNVIDVQTGYDISFLFLDTSTMFKKHTSHFADVCFE